MTPHDDRPAAPGLNGITDDQLQSLVREALGGDYSVDATYMRAVLWSHMLIARHVYAAGYAASQGSLLGPGYELIHTIWHALDDGEERPDEFAISLENFRALCKLLPDDHPAGEQSAPQVPREPTAEMIDAAYKLWAQTPIDADSREFVRALWQRMYDAAPPTASAQGEGHDWVSAENEKISGPVWICTKCKTITMDKRPPWGCTAPATAPVPAPAAAVAEPVKCVEKDCSEPSCMPNSEYCEFHARLEAGKGLLRDLGDPAIGGLTIAEMQRAHATPEPAPAATGDEEVRTSLAPLHSALGRIVSLTQERDQLRRQHEAATACVAAADAMRNAYMEARAIAGFANAPTPAAIDNYNITARRFHLLAQADAKGSKGAG